MHTDRIIPNHKTDIKIGHNDAEMLVDRNVVKKEATRFIKYEYKGLTTEIQRKCYVKEKRYQ